MTDFTRERYGEVIDDIKPLLAEHHRELALYQDDIPLDPDFDLYEQLDRSGVLRVYTARDNGRLIGYAIFVVRERHGHYAHRWAVNDILFIVPERRTLGVGSGLFDFFEADLREGGPVVVHIETKAEHPELAFLLQSRGYGMVGPSFGKRLA